VDSPILFTKQACLLIHPSDLWTGEENCFSKMFGWLGRFWPTITVSMKNRGKELKLPQAIWQPKWPYQCEIWEKTKIQMSNEFQNPKVSSHFSILHFEVNIISLGFGLIFGLCHLTFRWLRLSLPGEDDPDGKTDVAQE